MAWYICHMKNYTSEIKTYYATLTKTIKALNTNELSDAMNAVMRTYERGGTIYTCGNGGSASTASHFANDFNKGVSLHLQKKFKFYCLNDNIATVMAIANDISYDDVFSVQLDGRMTKNDLLIAISGSGNSKNIIKAVEYAKSIGAKVIGISGYDGGKLKQLADYKMHVEINDMQITEDIHMTFDHMIMKIFCNNFNIATH